MDVLTVHAGRVARHVAVMVAEGPDVVGMVGMVGMVGIGMGVMAMNRASLTSVSLADRCRMEGERVGTDVVLNGAEGVNETTRMLMDGRGIEEWRGRQRDSIGKRALQPLLFSLNAATRKPKIPKDPTGERVKMRCAFDSRRAQQPSRQQAVSQSVSRAHRLSSTCNDALPTTRLERRDATLRFCA